MMKRTRKTKKRKINNVEVPCVISPIIKKGKMEAAASIKAECMASIEAAAGASFSSALLPNPSSGIRYVCLYVVKRFYDLSTYRP